MKDDEYLNSRVNKLIDWYNDKSKCAQLQFKLLRMVEIISAASIPLIAGFATNPFPVTFVLGFLGALIAIISALISLNQLQEKWTKYRTACESLKHEKFLYITKTEPYNKEDSFNLLVLRVEALISKENSAWLQYTETSLENFKSNDDKG